MIKRIFSLVIVALAFTSCSKMEPVKKAMTDTKYAEGQVWNYKTREGEEESRLYIVKVESDEMLGWIFHIFVDGLEIKNPHLAGGVQSVLPHSPVSEVTLDKSVTSLLTESVETMPDHYCPVKRLDGMCKYLVCRE